MSAASPSTAPLKVRVRPAVEEDIPAVQEIYAHYVSKSTASFEDEPPTVAEMTARWQRVISRGMPYLVAVRGRTVLGYAYAAPFRERSAYRYTCEDSVYVAANVLGRDIGNVLMTALIERCTAFGFRQMIAVIGDSANAASLALHSRHGFYVIGALSSVGYKFGRWSDAVFMQRSLGDGDTTQPPGRPGRGKGRRRK
ncbi:MAG: N-acetyltransferase family protein [Rhodospirillaceae bacterium]|nr:MAG: N-acetyltransferase family protein [Rhodospirillaceae bacterium]